MGARIIVNGEFQHHGVPGQKWGVITRYVGVNYIPVGRRSGSGSSARDVLKTVGSGVASAAKKTASATSNTAKAIVRGAKAYKQEYDQKQAEKRQSKYRSGKPLTKKEIAKMTDQEVNAAINRRQREEMLYNMEHPQIAAGKEFMSKYIMNTIQSMAGDYAKKFLNMKVDKALGDFIRNNGHYTAEQKADMLERLNLMNSSDKIDKAIRDTEKLTKKIDDMGLDEMSTINLKKQMGVNTYQDDVMYDLYKKAFTGEKTEDMRSDIYSKNDEETAARIYKFLEKSSKK